MFGLILKNIIRNKRRSILTIIGVGISVFIICILLSLRNGYNKLIEVSLKNRVLATYEEKRACPWTSKLDENYKDEIKEIQGIEDVTSELIVLAHYGNSSSYANIIGIEADNYQNFKDIQIEKDSYKEFLKTKDGAVVGRKLSKLYNWKHGQKVVLKENNFTIKINGIFTSRTSLLESFILVHKDYVQEYFNLNGKVSLFLIKIKDLEQIDRISNIIDSRFENFPIKTKTQQEQAFWGDLIWQLNALKDFFDLMLLITIVTTILGTANSISMSVRERIREIGILRAIGFRIRNIFSLIVSEAIVITFIGGTLGCMASLVSIFLWEGLPISGLTLPYAINKNVIFLSIIIALSIGLLSSFYQALKSSYQKIISLLRWVE